MTVETMETETTAATTSGAPVQRKARGDVAQTARRVTVGGLNAWYGAQHAVKYLDIEFRPNEVTAIIGPSGCGKSTMVRCLNRMHEEVAGARSTGSVSLDGVDVYGAGVDVMS